MVAECSIIKRHSSESLACHSSMKKYMGIFIDGTIYVTSFENVTDIPSWITIFVVVAWHFKVGLSIVRMKHNLSQGMPIFSLNNGRTEWECDAALLAKTSMYVARCKKSFQLREMCLIVLDVQNILRARKCTTIVSKL